MKFNELWAYVMGSPKTLFFNFKYLKFSQAIKLPFFISHNVYLMETSGKIKIDVPIKPGLIRIGFGKVGLFDFHRSRTIWQVDGNVEFKGRLSIGHGSKVVVAKSGELVFGSDSKVTAESSIVCFKKVSIGSNCLISWDVLIMDTDFHLIKNKDGFVINENKEVIIGDKVWIGCRCLILKGSQIPNGCVLAAQSTINKKFTKEKSIVGGIPATILGRDIFWED